MTLVPLARGMAGDAYVVFARILESLVFGAAPAMVVLAALLGLWFAWPLAVRHGPGAPDPAVSRSTGPVEGQISRLKTIKRTMCGRAGFELLRHRVLKAA
jgi:hypothetical protein